MHGARRLRQWARRFASNAVILLYHRVADVPQDPQWLCVSPRHFAEHLEVLRHRYHLIGLSTLTKWLRWGLWLPQTVVVTFDDGYVDNLQQAKPLLEQADVPATVFVVAGQVGETREFWWDDLARVLLSTHTLPGVLELIIAGWTYTRRLGTQNGGDATLRGRWNVLVETDPTPKHTVYRELAALLRDLDYETRERTLTELADWAGLSKIGRPEYRALNAAELHSLALGGLVEVGAHTVNHPILSALPTAVQWEEVQRSKFRLEQILERPVTSFSYPFGGKGDYTGETVKLVRAAGFDCACSNFPGRVQPGTDPYQLPRFLVRDWDGYEFGRQLAGWFHD